MKLEWSINEQKDLLTRLGYDVSKWDPENQEEVAELANLATNAILSGRDAHGERLSHEDLDLLSIITGH